MSENVLFLAFKTPLHTIGLLWENRTGSPWEAAPRGDPARRSIRPCVRPTTLRDENNLRRGRSV